MQQLDKRFIGLSVAMLLIVLFMPQYMLPLVPGITVSDHVTVEVPASADSVPEGAVRSHEVEEPVDPLLGEHIWPPPVGDVAPVDDLAWETYGERLQEGAQVFCTLDGARRYSFGYAELAAPEAGVLGPGFDVEVVDGRLALSGLGLADAGRATVTLQGFAPFEIRWDPAAAPPWTCEGETVSIERDKTRAYGLVAGLPESGCPEARVEGCGNHVEVDPEHGFMMTVPSEPCALVVRVADVSSNPVEVAPVVGEPVRVDLELPAGAEDGCSETAKP